MSSLYSYMMLWVFFTICVSIICSSWNHNVFHLSIAVSLAVTPAAFEIFWFLPQTFVISSVTMVMGIPTVKRKVKSYLSETLRSLIDKLSPEEKLDCVIIVFVGEVRCPVWGNIEKSSTERLSNVLICFGLCRLILIMLMVWLLTSRKSEYISSWRGCQVGMSVLHVDATNILLFRFSTELNSGLLEVISPPAAYYPDLGALKETFGDSRERVK